MNVTCFTRKTSDGYSNRVYGETSKWDLINAIIPISYYHVIAAQDGRCKKCISLMSFIFSRKKNREPKFPVRMIKFHIINKNVEEEKS